MTEEIQKPTFQECDHVNVTPGCEDCDDYQRRQEAAWEGYARRDRTDKDQGKSVADANFDLAFAAVQVDQMFKNGNAISARALLDKAVKRHSAVLERFT